MSLELEVPTIWLVTGGVSVRRDRRYELRLEYNTPFIPYSVYNAIKG